MTDPVKARRARIARLNRVVHRAGYLLYGVAIVAFVLGMVGQLTSAITATVVSCLVVGSLLLAPTIIIGYGVRAADREDRQAGR